MLGQEHVPLYNDQDRLTSVTLRMGAYVRGMVMTFKGKLPTKPVNEPFSPKSKVSKDVVVDPAESVLVLAAGYLRAVGLLDSLGCTTHTSRIKVRHQYFGDPLFVHMCTVCT